LGRKEASRILLLEDALLEPPRVCIGLEVIEKIHCFVQLAHGEINGMGMVEKIGNDFVITEAFILKQDAGAAHAEIDPMALNRLVSEREDYGKLHFQWHSHVYMPARFSSIDTANIAGYAGYFGDFMISFVTNKRSEYSCRLDLFRPFYVGFEVPLTVIVPLQRDLLEECREDMRAKIGGSSLLDLSFDVNGERPRSPAMVSLGDISFEREA
jgi:hypothetical protein